MTTSASPSVKLNKDASTSVSEVNCPMAMLATALIFASALAVWHACNHALPAPDDSSYILASFKYADLLRHPKLCKPDWWHCMLTVNQAYPPAVMMFNGALRLFFGHANWVNILSVTLFSMVLTATTYGAGLALTGYRRAAVLSSIIVNLYPEVWCTSHLFALDAPLIAMVSCALFSILWWRRQPSYRRALACGVVLGAACLTKQIAAAYLLLPGLYCFAEAVRADYSTKRVNLTSKLAVAAAIAAAIVLPWWLTNLEFIRHWANDNQTSMGHLPLYQVFPQRIAWYLCSLPSIMSPLLVCAFVGAVCASGANTHRSLLPLSLSAIGGVGLISTLTWAFPSLRYDAPVLIATSVYTGTAMSAFWRKRLLAATFSLIIATAFIQFFCFNFTPYPITQPSWLPCISEALGVRVVEQFGLTDRDRRGISLSHDTPAPPQDWGHEWCIRSIDKLVGRQQCFLNILPDTGGLNGNTFELAARMLGSAVRPTTSRRWTVMGDEVTFDSKVALYYQFYLLKTGNQGNIFRNDTSAKNYRQLMDFVQHSGKFELIGTHPVADGSALMLYRQR